jgi:hypothetical protein
LFQSSSAVTVKLKEVPAAAVAGTLTDKLLAAPALTLIELEVPLIEALTVSVAVMVCEPAVFNVAEKTPVPFVNVELAGEMTAWASLLVTCTVPA